MDPLSTVVLLLLISEDKELNSTDIIKTKNEYL